MTVVFDTNVVVEAIFWPRSTARRALAGLTLNRRVLSRKRPQRPHRNRGSRVFEMRLSFTPPVKAVVGDDQTHFLIFALLVFSGG